MTAVPWSPCSRRPLNPTEEETDRWVAGYPATRAMLNVLYAVPDARYEEPAVTFDPRVER
jgi:hypothetical protein